MASSRIAATDRTANGMVLTPEGELESQGFRVFGYFRWQAQVALAA